MTSEKPIKYVGKDKEKDDITFQKNLGSASSLSSQAIQGGDEYMRDQRLILAALERLEEAVKEQTTALSGFKVDTAVNFGEVNSKITSIQVKAGFVGIVGGIISAAIVVAMSLLKMKP